MMDYSLVLAQNIKVTSKTMARWEKNPKRLLIHTHDRNNQKAKMLFVTALVEAISNGLVAKFPVLEIFEDPVFKSNAIA